MKTKTTSRILAAALALGLVPGWANAAARPRPEKARPILMVVTSHGTFPSSGKKTGLWLEEFAVPYRIFSEAGHEVTVASPQGGAAPIDPRSLEPDALPENADEARKILQDTVVLGEVDLSGHAAVFFAGGHGTMFDFPDNPPVQETVEYFWRNKRPLGLVCHGPAALVGAHAADGSTPLVAGRKVAAFTNDEERAVGLEKAVPFLLQTKLETLGAEVATADPFMEQTVADGYLVTGQNPASSAQTARRLLEQL